MCTQSKKPRPRRQDAALCATSRGRHRQEVSRPMGIARRSKHTCPRSFPSVRQNLREVQHRSRLAQRSVDTEQLSSRDAKGSNGTATSLPCKLTPRQAQSFGCEPSEQPFIDTKVVVWGQSRHNIHDLKVFATSREGRRGVGTIKCTRAPFLF